jgi:hypothetical protein
VDFREFPTVGSQIFYFAKPYKQGVRGSGALQPIDIIFKKVAPELFFSWRGVLPKE